jgi:hypothetical protein
VNKSTKSGDYDVFLKAWETLFQRIENTISYGNFPRNKKDQNGIVITDATSGNKLTRLVRRMAVYNPVPNMSSIYGVGTGSRNLPISKIVEDPHGKDSKDTLPIQACDVCAYFLLQMFSPNSYIKRQHASKYYERLSPVLNRRASKAHPLGIVVI